MISFTYGFVKVYNITDLDMSIVRGGMVMKTAEATMFVLHSNMLHADVTVKTIGLSLIHISEPTRPY